MKKSLQAFLVAACLAFSGLLARAHAQVGANTSEHEATATEYCKFLNQYAASDPDHLYDEKMGADPEAACILRLGTPKKYFYEVIAGRENIPISFVSVQTERAYYAWKGCVLAVSTDDDLFLKCNRVNFFVIENNNSPQTLMDPVISVVVDSSTTEIIEAVAAGIGSLLLGGGIGHEMGGNEIDVEVQEQTTRDASSEAATGVSEVREGAIDKQGQKTSLSTERDLPHSRYTEIDRVYDAARPAAIETPISHEHSEISDLLRMALRNEQPMLHHFYGKTDQLWAQTEQAWDDRTVAQREARAAREMIAIAKELHQKVTEARAKVDLQKTILGRVAQGAELSAKALGFVPCPLPLAGTATTIAEATKLINKTWEDFKVGKAEIAVACATREKDAAAKRANDANATATELERKAHEAEASARAHATVVAKISAQAAKPPYTSLNVDDWNRWATHIVEKAAADRDAIERIVEYAMRYPTLVAEEAAAAWADKMAFSEQEIKNNAAQKEIDMRSHERLLSQVNQAVQITKKAANLDKKSLVEAIAAHAEAVKNLEEINDELNKLEDARGNDRVVEKKRREFFEVFTAFHEACDEVEKIKKQAVASNQAAALEEEKALPVRKIYTAVEKFLLRNSERAKVQAAADQAAWKAIWPEKNKRFPQMSLKSGETKIESSEPIEPPLIYHEAAEAAGRAFLKQRERERVMAAEISQQGAPEMASKSKAVDDSSVSNEEVDLKSGLDDEPMNAPLTSENEPGSFFNIPEIIEPTEDDTQRWDEREAADLLAERAAAAAVAKEKEIQSRNSVVESVAPSMKSGVTGIFQRIGVRLSTLGSVRGVALDEATTLERDVASANRLAAEAEDRWVEHARLAEAMRISNHGVFVDEPVALDAWLIADRAAVAARKENRKIEEEEFRAARVEHEWAANTARWKALEEADITAEAADELQKNAEEKNQLLAHAGNISWSEREALREAAAVAQTKAAEAKVVADEAGQKWSALADLDQSMISAWAQDEVAVESAKAKLKEADRAVNALARRIQFNAIVRQNDEAADGVSASVQEATIQPATSRYKKLLNKRKKFDYDELFPEDDPLERTAKTKYHSRADGVTRAEALHLYDQLDQREVKKLDEYEERANKEALRAAREKIPGALEAWKQRAIQAARSAEVAATIFNGQQAAAAEDAAAREEILNTELSANDAWRTLQRAKAIARADGKALRTFQREAARLDDIEKTWIAEREAEERLAKMERESAARDYYLHEDPRAWNALPAAQRATYNQAVVVANKSYDEKAARELELETAQKNEKDAYGRMNILRDSFLVLNKESKREVTRQEFFAAKNGLESKKALEMVRLELIRWGSLMHSQENEKKTHEKVIEFWSKATQQYQAAAEYNVRSAQAYEAGKKESAEHLGGHRDPSTERILGVYHPGAARSARRAAEIFTRAAEQVAKAAEAANAESQEAADFWTQAVTQSQLAAEYHIESAQAWVAGKIKEACFLGGGWDIEGASTSAEQAAENFATAAEQITKAAKASILGNQEAANLWTQAAIQSQMAAIHRSVSAQAWAAAEWEETTRVSGEKYHNGGAIRATEHAAGNFAAAAEQITKATEATAAENQEAANLWTQAATQSRIAAEYHIQSAQAWTDGKRSRFGNYSSDTYDSARDAARAAEYAAANFTSAAQQVAKAAEATTSESQEAADFWIQAVRQSQLAAEYHIQSTQAYAAGKREDAKRLGYDYGSYSGSGYAWSAEHAAKNFAKAAEQPSKIAEQIVKAAAAMAAGNQEEASLWTQAAKQSQLAVGYCIKAALAWVAGNKREAESLGYDGDNSTTGASGAAERAAENFAKAAEQTAKATEATAAKNKESATLWTQAAKESQVAADYRIQSAQAWVEEKREKAMALNGYNAVFSGASLSEEAARKLVKQAEAAEFAHARMTEAKK